MVSSCAVTSFANPYRRCSATTTLVSVVALSPSSPTRPTSSVDAVAVLKEVAANYSAPAIHAPRATALNQTVLSVRVLCAPTKFAAPKVIYEKYACQSQL